MLHVKNRPKEPKPMMIKWTTQIMHDSMYNSVDDDYDDQLINMNASKPNDSFKSFNLNRF